MNYNTSPFCVAVIAALFLSSPVSAKSTFLPDWLETGIGVEGDFNKDENYCIEAEKDDGSKFYHKGPTCPEPKVFNETCPMDETYISDCYCPAIYNKTCLYPYRGDERIRDKDYASCDGKYIACCDTTCPAGTFKEDPGGCGGSTTNGCGDTCYYPYQPCCTPESDETGCSCGSEPCDDGCGGTRQCCKPCPEPEPTPPPCFGCECDNSCVSSSGGASGGDIPPIEPEKCTDTCESKGYLSSKAKDKECKSVEVCDQTCYKCTDIDKCKDAKDKVSCGTDGCKTYDSCGKCTECKPACVKNNCSGYTLSACPNYAYCSQCTEGCGNNTPKFKVNSCHDTFTLKNGQCVCNRKEVRNGKCYYCASNKIYVQCEYGMREKKNIYDRNPNDRKGPVCLSSTKEACSYCGYGHGRGGWVGKSDCPVNNRYEVNRKEYFFSRIKILEKGSNFKEGNISVRTYSSNG